MDIFYILSYISTAEILALVTRALIALVKSYFFLDFYKKRGLRRNDVKPLIFYTTNSAKTALFIFYPIRLRLPYITVLPSGHNMYTVFHPFFGTQYLHIVHIYAAPLYVIPTAPFPSIFLYVSLANPPPELSKQGACPAHEAPQELKAFEVLLFQSIQPQNEDFYVPVTYICLPLLVLFPLKEHNKIIEFFHKIRGRFIEQRLKVKIWQGYLIL